MSDTGDVSLESGAMAEGAAEGHDSGSIQNVASKEIIIDVKYQNIAPFGIHNLKLERSCKWRRGRSNLIHLGRTFSTSGYLWRIDENGASHRTVCATRECRLWWDRRREKGISRCKSGTAHLRKWKSFLPYFTKAKTKLRALTPLSAFRRSRIYCW